MKETKYGVYINGKLSFSNVDYDVTNGYAQYIMKKDFSSHIWLAKIGSFVTA